MYAFLLSNPGEVSESTQEENGKDPEELTIPEKVKLRGNIAFGGAGDYITEKYKDVESLIKDSQFVIKGRVAAVKSYLSPSQEEIRTDFILNVLEIIESQSPESEPPESVVMMWIGGKMKFPNGTAEYTVGEYLPDSYPIVGQVLILFLEPNSLDSSKFQPVGDTRGIFTISNDMIDSPASRTCKLHAALKGKKVDLFEKEIKDKSYEARSRQ